MSIYENWFVGNSQLNTSILAAYCSEEEREEIHKKRLSQEIAQGAFKAEAGKQFSFISCSMDKIGSLSYDSGVLGYSEIALTIPRLISKEARTVVLMLRGNEFAYQSLVDSERWDFPYGVEAATKGRQFVNQKDALAYYAKIMNPTLATCLLYKHVLPASTVYYVPAPPPIEDSIHILENPESFGNLFRECGLKPFVLRKKIYDAMHIPLSEQLKQYGIETIFTPTECVTANGGLRSEFACGCLHGNERYGVALLSALIERGVYAPI